MASLAQILEDVEIGEEVAAQVATDFAALSAGAAASSTFDATVFGHKQAVTISFAPVPA